MSVVLTLSILRCVLKVTVKTDKGGRKAVEYLIHFQGWNSSWDRYVSEDYILKHTDENWRLQKKLAEKAQLRPGAYLYRRDRKEQLSRILCKTDYSIQEKHIQCVTPSTVSRGGSVSSHSNYSIEAYINDDNTKKDNTDRQQMGNECVMEDKQMHPGCNDADVSFGGHSEESYYSNDNCVEGSFDDCDGDVKGISNGHESKNICGQDSADEWQADNKSHTSRHEADENCTQFEEGTAEHLKEDNFTLEISDVMKEILELDNELIKTKNKIIRLPARPNVVTILESYVREYAIKQIYGSPEKTLRKYKRQQYHQNGHLDVERINRSVNFCKEVADGVRIYFDFTLSGLLLYNEEREQYEQSRHMTVTKGGDSKLSSDALKEEEKIAVYDPADLAPTRDQSTNQEDKVTESGNGNSNFKTYSRSHNTKSPENKLDTSFKETTNGSNKETDISCLISTDLVKNETCVPSTASKEEAFSTFCDNVSSVTSISSRHTPQSVKSDMSPAEGMLNSKTCLHSSSDFLLTRVLEWQLVPTSAYEEKPVAPSLIYGAVHLARLFVKLPSLLVNTDMPMKKLKVVLRHLQMILRYLEQNKDWLVENEYQDSLWQEKND